MTLNELKIGETAAITAVGGDGALRCRLLLGSLGGCLLCRCRITGCRTVCCRCCLNGCLILCSDRCHNSIDRILTVRSSTCSDDLR